MYIALRFPCSISDLKGLSLDFWGRRVWMWRELEKNVKCRCSFWFFDSCSSAQTPDLSHTLSPLRPSVPPPSLPHVAPLLSTETVTLILGDKY